DAGAVVDLEPGGTLPQRKARGVDVPVIHGFFAAHHAGTEVAERANGGQRITVLRADFRGGQRAREQERPRRLGEIRGTAAPAFVVYRHDPVVAAIRVRGRHVGADHGQLGPGNFGQEIGGGRGGDRA